jgi:hypothetical protein
LKGKLTATINATNFFEEDRIFRSFTESQNFLTENINTFPFRNLGISISYNFGKLKENVSKKKGVKNDDEVE